MVAQFERIRARSRRRARSAKKLVAVASRTPEQRQYLTASVTQFWDAVDRIFALAAAGTRRRGPRRRSGCRCRRGRRRSAPRWPGCWCRTTRPRSRPRSACWTIYARSSARSTGSSARRSTTILLTSLYLIRSNRRLFAELGVAVRRAPRAGAAADCDARIDAARDLARAARRVRPAADGDGIDARAGRPPGAGRVRRCRPTCTRSARSRRSTLDNVRGLSQTLHPSILEDAGLEGTVDWYLSTVERQSGAGRIVRAERARRGRWTAPSGFTSTACCRRRSAMSPGIRALTEAWVRLAYVSGSPGARSRGSWRRVSTGRQPRRGLGLGRDARARGACRWHIRIAASCRKAGRWFA